jgi:hypothetical protein
MPGGYNRMDKIFFYRKLYLKKAFLGIFILFFVIKLFGEGAGETNSLSYNKYAEYGPPKEDYYYGYGVYRHNVIYGTVKDSRGEPIHYEDNMFYYNEYYNENIQSPIRLKERINLTGASTNADYIGKYTVIQEKNRIEIQVEHTDHRGRPRWGDNGTVVLAFDEDTGRLVSMKTPYKYDFYGDGTDFSYVYDDEGRLSGIYVLHNGEKILRKQYFYNGKPRFLYRPFFIDENVSGLEEIVVYDGTELRYIAKIFPGPWGPAHKTREQMDRMFHVTVFEYRNGIASNLTYSDLLRKTAYYDGQDLYGVPDEPVRVLYCKEGFNEPPLVFDN